MQLTPQRREALSSATLTQTLGLMVVFSGVLVVASNATQPAWWLSRGAVRPVQVTTNSGVVTTNYIPNDYMVVTQGQLKQFTARAVEEMNAHLSGGAGTNLNSLVSNWAADYASNGYNATNLKPSDYTAMTAGQLKYIGHLVWTRLVAAGVTNAVPSWLATNALDHQLANLGQVKSVFNFELAAPALTPPQPVTNLTATAGTDEIDLAWTNPGGGSAEGGDSAEGIVIEVSADGGATWSTVTTLDPNADTYAASADPSQSRNYRVTRENSSGSSSSASTTPVTPNSGPPVPRFAVIDLGINIAAYGMNASGAVVGNRYDPANSPTEDDYYSEPIEWSQGQIYPLALPGGVAFQVDDMTWTAVAQPVGISDGGVIVGDPMVGDRLVDPIYWPNKDAGPIDLVSGASFAPFWGDGTNPYQMGIPAYVQSIASDGTVFGSDTSPVSDPCEETVRYLPSFAVLWDAGPESSVIVYGASGHWAADYGSDDGSGFEGANIDGVMHPGFWVFGLNDSGLAVGYSYYGPPYEAFLIGPANIDLGPGWALALNNATVTVNGHTIPQPQIVGIDFDSDYVPHGLLWDHLNLDGTPAAKYVAKKLDDLLPASSGWSQTYPAAINLGGAICGMANYSGTNSAIPAGEHGVILVPFQVSYDKADNTPFFPTFGKTDPYDPSAHQPTSSQVGPDFPDQTKTRQAALVIYNKPVRQTGGTFGSIIDFDVNLNFAAGNATTVQWSKADGPTSGTLVNPTSASAIYRNPKQGGLYKFDMQALEQTTRVQVWCPTAGPEIKTWTVSELQWIRQWVANYNANLPLKYHVPGFYEIDTTLDFWSIAGGADWTGRFYSAHSPDGGPDLGGDLHRHTICGVVVERHKLSNMLTAFLSQEMLSFIPQSIVISEFGQKGRGSSDGSTQIASYHAGFDLQAAPALNENTLTTVMQQYGYSMQEPNSWAEHEWPSLETPTSGGIIHPLTFSDFQYQ